MDEVKVTIIGAGVVGLAVAAEVTAKVQDVLVLEQHDSFGRETSSRNSEVIHSGIYYSPGSLKAGLCVEGAQRLYHIGEQYAIAHKKLGKLVVAVDESEIPKLKNLFNNGRQNGVSGLRILDAKDVAAFGSHFRAAAALHVPDTGIIDTHSLMKHFARGAEGRGATIAYNSKVTSITPLSGGFILSVEDGYTFSSRLVVNCAGLFSDAVAALAGIDIAKNAYTLHYCKGSYFAYSKRYPMPMLIYPVPHQELTGLGVHATVDLAGRLRFGPDAEYVGAIDYTVDESKRDAFYAEASKLFYDLDKEAFAADMAGIRPKLSGPGEAARDFIIADEAKNGLPGLIDCIGIESPGLTSAPAIARMVAEMVVERLA